MNTAQMKMFHWAHDWPNHYLEVWYARDTRYVCYQGHCGCSLIESGPCISRVIDDVDRGVKDREGSDS